MIEYLPDETRRGGGEGVTVRPDPVFQDFLFYPECADGCEFGLSFLISLLALHGLVHIT